ncbi:DUF938 domain-containing protein [Shimia abyssi]|uniref:Uncharacterized protein DUF938 n=1 Tax=Shimia abyssi TaxID=1662395 RepID=A0A2P8FHK6_9RHOB|nr:DUF938 domain-containing protein [Shimia abyssi]PSL21175.1 uncharacterized protein DUF938 [Shimia abyssi]
MPERRKLPPSASVATPDENGKLFAPSPDRNAGVITDFVSSVAPVSGNALEIASGTGQHIIQLAAAMPGLHWQPTEIAPERRASIDTYLSEANLSNTSPAIQLDATAPGWGAHHQGQSLILLVNLLHLVSKAEAQTLVAEAAQALKSGGLLVVYGPFMRGDTLISEGDARFHANLQSQDPEIGYKSDQTVIKWGIGAGLSHQRTTQMPANNLALCWQKT